MCLYTYTFTQLLFMTITWSFYIRMVTEIFFLKPCAPTGPFPPQYQVGPKNTNYKLKPHPHRLTFATY